MNNSRAKEIFIATADSISYFDRLPIRNQAQILNLGAYLAKVQQEDFPSLGVALAAQKSADEKIIHPYLAVLTFNQDYKPFVDFRSQVYSHIKEENLLVLFERHKTLDEPTLREYMDEFLILWLSEAKKPPVIASRGADITGNLVRLTLAVASLAVLVAAGLTITSGVMTNEPKPQITNTPIQIPRPTPTMLTYPTQVPILSPTLRSTITNTPTSVPTSISTSTSTPILRTPTPIREPTATRISTQTPRPTPTLTEKPLLFPQIPQVVEISEDLPTIWQIMEKYTTDALGKDLEPRLLKEIVKIVLISNDIADAQLEILDGEFSAYELQVGHPIKIDDVARQAILDLSN